METIMHVILLGLVIILFYYVRNERIIKASKKHKIAVAFFLLFFSTSVIFFGFDLFTQYLRSYFETGLPSLLLVVWGGAIGASLKTFVFGLEIMPEEASN